MKTNILILVAALGCATLTSRAYTIELMAMQTTNDQLIAIDVLLEPDQTMIGKAQAVNARLRGNYPAGYELDATHAPHVTLLQRFVRAKDFDAVTAAVARVLAAERPTDLQLKANALEYVIWGGVAVTVLAVERTPELMRLHETIIDAVAPYSVNGGTATAFVGGDANTETIGWVETFVPKSSGAHYIPHVTAGVAPEAFVKQLKGEPFAAFTFKPVGIGIYHLGNGRRDQDHPRFVDHRSCLEDGRGVRREHEKVSADSDGHARSISAADGPEVTQDSDRGDWRRR